MLVDGIDLNIEKEYNPAKVFINSDNSDAFNTSDLKNLTFIKTNIICELASNNTGITPNTIVHQTTDINILNKLYLSYFRSKSSRTIKRDKSKTITTNKLKEVYADLWRP